MTLVYSAQEPGSPDGQVLPPTPVTHAFVIGCGRFPHLSPNGDLDRGATTVGARDMLKFLTCYGPSFRAPLATIECLMSDPAHQAGQDSVNIVQGPIVGGPHPPPCLNIRVEAATENTVKRAGRDWVRRCRPGDHMFFYMSSHGIATADAALGLLEDVGSDDLAKWSQALNIKTLSQGLLTRKAAQAWVFLDACQEIVPEILGLPTGTPGVHLIEYSVQDLRRASKQQAVALAGSRFGGTAWAPTNGRAPYFTQALLEGLRNACVEAVANVGWVVTGKQIIYGLKAVAEAVLDWPGLEVEVIVDRFHPAHVELMTITSPKVPIKVSTSTEAHIARVVNGSAVAHDDQFLNVPWAADPEGKLAWRFTVDAKRGREFTASLNFKDGRPTYKPKAFYADPPAQIVVLEP